MSKLRINELESLETGRSLKVDEIDTDVRLDLANPDKGVLMVRGAVIYVDTIADLQALPTSELVGGQIASVFGSEFKYSSGAWQAIGPVDVRAYGAKGDGSTDDRDAIQQCVNENTHIVIRDGVYMVDGNDPAGPSGRQGVRVPSNRIIEFDNSEVRILPSDQDGYNAFLVRDVENVVFKRPVIIGDRDQHIGTTGEWGMGFELISAKNIRIDEGIIRDCWGDGIYIGQRQEGDGPCRDIYIDRTVCDNNRRQGMSVVSVDGLYVSDSKFKNTNGTGPGAGVDFEPNFAYETLNNIHFKNVETENNTGSGVLFWLGNLSNNGNVINMTFDSLRDVGSAKAVYFGSRMLASGTGAIVFNDLVSRNAVQGGVAVRDWDKAAPRIVFDKPTIVNSTTSSTSTATAENSGFSCFTLSSFDTAGGVFGNVEIHDPKFVNDGSVPVYAPCNIHFPASAENCYLSYSPSQRNAGSENYGAGLVFDIKNTLIVRKEILLNSWAGTSPVTTNLIPSRVYTRVENEPTKHCILILPDMGPGSSQNVSIDIGFIGGNNGFTIRPPSGGVLRSAGLFNNGIHIPLAARITGTSAKVRYINGEWHLISYLGGWENAS